MKKLAEIMANSAAFSICDLVCDGRCGAIDGFRTTKYEFCIQKIEKFLDKHLEDDVMKDGLFETKVNKYRKRPCEIEAIRFTRSNFEDIKYFTGGKAKDMFIERRPNGKCTCVIEILEGDLTATEGDFIIRGIKGEFYACKPDVFFQSYELMDSVN